MSRQAMLALLRAHPDEFLSGEQVSAQLGLSRTAIWKAVDALRRDGYTVEARTGLGYRLIASPNLLTEEAIRSFLRPTSCVGRELHCLETVDSTNTAAKKLAIAGAPDGTVVTANAQTAGRGRLGRTFDSPQDQGVYFTVLLRPRMSPRRLLSVTALGAVAVCRAIRRSAGIDPQIKWTNDVVVNRKKLCGILTEMGVEGESGSVQYLVMGIGVNVLQRPEDFEPPVREIATSLQMELGTAISRAVLTACLTEELDEMYSAWTAGKTQPYLEDYRRACVTLGREIRILRPDGSCEHAAALDIDDDFGLVIRRDSGERTVIRSGEASVRGMYGYIE